MKIDTRLFAYAGSSVDPDGSAKARFANDPEARPKVLQKQGHTNFVLVALPTPMTKLDAIKYLQDVKPEGVDQLALTAKAAYINAQNAKIEAAKQGISKKRGRPAKNSDATVAKMVKAQKAAKTVTKAKAVKPAKKAGVAVDSIVNTIVTTARAGKSIRAKAAAHSGQVSAARLDATV